MGTKHITAGSKKTDKFFFFELFVCSHIEFLKIFCTTVQCEYRLVFGTDFRTGGRVFIFISLSTDLFSAWFWCFGFARTQSRVREMVEGEQVGGLKFGKRCFPARASRALQSELSWAPPNRVVTSHSYRGAWKKIGKVEITPTHTRKSTTTPTLAQGPRSCSFLTRLHLVPFRRTPPPPAPPRPASPRARGRPPALRRGRRSGRRRQLGRAAAAAP